MATAELVDLGKTAFKEQKWNDAFTHLSNADDAQALQPDDLEILAISAYLTGKFNVCNDTLTRSHNALIKEGNIPKAVRCAFWLGFLLVNKGESARGGGWFGHAKKLLDQYGKDCVEQGYLLLPVALRCLGEGDAEGSFRVFNQALEIGNRFFEQDLLALAHLGQGQAIIRMGEPHKGVIFLDEAMVAVDTGELSPIVVGIIYCGVIETCLEIFDLSRAQEWTDALSDWCSSHPYLVPFRGQCLTRRSEIMLLHGKWTDAIKEINHAIDLLSKPTAEPAVGAAFYQLGELYRLQGDFKKAEQAYSEGNKYGKNPQPGLALLRLAQGQVERAKSSINNTFASAKKIKNKSDMLFAFIEIMLAAEDVGTARSSLNELKKIVKDHEAPLLNAVALQAEGAILLAEEDPKSALEKLRNARKTWDELKAPYEAAKTRELIAKASHAMGDKDTAELEYEAAKWTFQQLKATPDLTRIDKYFNLKTSPTTGGLTDREKQVIQLIADGKSNKTIAEELFISERTVERHVSNIFGKLDVSSRSAATAYAYKNQLL